MTATWRTWLSVLPLALSGCVPGSLWRVPLEARSVQIRIVRADSECHEAEYTHGGQYKATLMCPSEPRPRSRTGVIGHGVLSLTLPEDCQDARLEFDLWPFDRLRCDSAHVGPVQTAAYRDRELIVQLVCEAESRSAKRAAAPILECNERELAVTPQECHTFFVQGCGRTLVLRCADTPTDGADPCQPIAERE